ncbi:MAG: hypothetical protein ABI721_05310 [Candidatus Dojkabacteria bacterium]
MKTFIKIIISLILLIVFILGCFVLTLLTFTGIIFNSYQVFTDKKEVAELTISEAKSDVFGEYADVTVTPINNESTALTWILLNNKSETKVNLPVKSFKVYGDFVFIGGPIVKFNDGLALINFKTIYKLASLSGEYKFDLVKEKNRPNQAFSKFQFDGGYDDWKPVFNNWKQPGILGDIYRNLIQTTEDQEVGTDITNTELKYIVYITNSGFQIEQAR